MNELRRTSRTDCHRLPLDLSEDKSSCLDLETSSTSRSFSNFPKRPNGCGSTCNKSSKNGCGDTCNEPPLSLLLPNRSTSTRCHTQLTTNDCTSFPLPYCRPAEWRFDLFYSPALASQLPQPDSYHSGSVMTLEKYNHHAMLNRPNLNCHYTTNLHRQHHSLHSTFLSFHIPYFCLCPCLCPYLCLFLSTNRFSQQTTFSKSLPFALSLGLWEAIHRHMSYTLTSKTSSFRHVC